MIFKLIILAVVLYIIYTLFFKNQNFIEKIKPKEQKNPKEKNPEVDTVVECHKCGVYVSTKEAIIKDGFYFCSKECAEIK